jgi:hypothetical protein
MARLRCLCPVSHVLLDLFLPSSPANLGALSPLPMPHLLVLLDDSSLTRILNPPSSIRTSPTALESASDNSATYFLSAPSCQRTIFALWKGQLVQNNIEEKDPDVLGGTKVVGIQYELVSPLAALGRPSLPLPLLA